MKRRDSSLPNLFAGIDLEEQLGPCCDCGGVATGLGMSTGGKRPTCDSCEIDRLGMVIAILDSLPDDQRDAERLKVLAQEYERVKLRVGAE